MKTNRMKMMETSGLKTKHPKKTKTWVEEAAAISWLEKLTCGENVVAGSRLKRLICIEDVVVASGWLERPTCNGTVFPVVWLDRKQICSETFSVFCCSGVSNSSKPRDPK